MSVPKELSSRPWPSQSTPLYGWMRIVEHDGKDEAVNQSISSSKYTINTPDQHAHGRDMSDQEPNNAPMVLQHPSVYIGHREETTGLDRNGGPNGRDEISMTTTHFLDE